VWGLVSELHTCFDVCMRIFHVYIMTNRNRTVVYTGVTNNLTRRVAEHKSQHGSKFARRYKISVLVYAESYPTALEAIGREKQIKKYSRAKKDALINVHNPEWRDLSLA
jgi:putative endonuclease